MWIGLQEGRATITALHHCTNAVMHTCYAECINTALDKAEKVQYMINMIRTQWTEKNVQQIKSDGRLEQKWALEDRWCWEGWVGGWWARAQGGLGRSAPPPADASQSASSRPSPKTKMREIVHLQVGFCSLYLHFYLLLLTLLTLFHYIKNLECDIFKFVSNSFISSYVSWCFLLSDQNSQLP